MSQRKAQLRPGFPRFEGFRLGLALTRLVVGLFGTDLTFAPGVKGANPTQLPIATLQRELRYISGERSWLSTIFISHREMTRPDVPAPGFVVSAVGLACDRSLACSAETPSRNLAAPKFLGNHEPGS